MNKILIISFISFIIILIIIINNNNKNNNKIKFNKKNNLEHICSYNGNEPEYNRNLWNNNNNIQDSHNCYAYALNDICDPLIELCENTDCEYINPQPGHYCGSTKRVNYDETNCASLYERMLCDNPELELSTCENKCPDDKYKIGLTIGNYKTDDKHETYHYYRQDNDGLWSHKDGGGEAKALDASNNLIYNPEFADRDYNNIDYHTWCGYYCIPHGTNIARNDYFNDKLHYECSNI